MLNTKRTVLYREQRIKDPSTFNDFIRVQLTKYDNEHENQPDYIIQADFVVAGTEKSSRYCISGYHDKPETRPDCYYIRKAIEVFDDFLEAHPALGETREDNNAEGI